MRVLVQSAPDEYEVMEITDITYEHELDANDYNGDTSGLVFITADGTLFAIPGVPLNTANAICERICITGYADLREYGVCIDVTHLP